MNLAQEQEKQQILAHQKETLERQVTQRTAALKQSLEELKQTQAQLIQKEKMASLGALTLGIAHEIQNPINFINNFAEVNKELIIELKEELHAEKKRRYCYSKQYRRQRTKNRSSWTTGGCNCNGNARTFKSKYTNERTNRYQ